YGGTVTPDQNNYCGLGTTSATVKGAYFPSSKIGVRAHIQHLLAYTSTRRPTEPVVDPRYTLVCSRYGDQTLGTWGDLNGRWAVPGYSYGQSIMSMFRAILNE
ncbi:MAG: glucosaminidase domain-containing protein, partial [Selenomonadaceae bacterium]|nr:glucosaminidase domain-containing protein [Selenomonadaceae bacterium]